MGHLSIDPQSRTKLLLIAMTTVSCVDDDSAYCLLLTQALAKNKTIRLLSVHSRAEEALQSLPSLRPDVVLMDIKFAGMDGIECLKRLKQVEPPLLMQVLMLTQYPDDALVFESLKAGASGYLLKDHISVNEVSAAIKTVMAGGGVMSPNIARKVIQSFRATTASFATLSQRETEILRYLSDGLMYKEIAPKLDISLNTVRTHVGAVYRKLHVQSRMDAARNYLHDPR